MASVPGQRDVVEEPPKVKGNSTETKSTVDAGADAAKSDAKADAKSDAKADAKSDTKADAKSEAKVDAKAVDSLKNDTEGTKKSATPLTGEELIMLHIFLAFVQSILCNQKSRNNTNSIRKYLKIGNFVLPPYPLPVSKFNVAIVTYIK